MKNILVAAIFLFSQLGMSTEKINKTDVINAKGYHLENETLSSLFLTKEELVHLSDKDKTVYFISMIALSQILEGAQADVMGYSDTIVEPINGKKTSSIYLEKMNSLFATIKNAEAIAPLVIALDIAATAAIEGLIFAGRYVMKKLGGNAVKGALKTVSETLGKSLEEGAAKTNLVRSFVQGSKEAIKASKEAVTLNLKNYKAAMEAVKSAKNPAEAEQLAAVAREAELNWKRANAAFMKNAPDPKKAEAELKKMAQDSKVWAFVKDHWVSVLGGTLAYKGAEAYFKEDTGLSITPSGILAAQEAEAKLDSAGNPAAVMAEKKGCLFGGHPSVWVDFKDGGPVKCTRPAASKSDACPGENGFLCNSYGITLPGVGTALNVCQKLEPRENLTVRCSQDLINTIKSQKAALKDETLLAFTKHLQEQAKQIEAQDGMKDDDGKTTKSIAAYCHNNDAQKDVCEAVNAVLAALKGTEVPKLLAARPPTPAAGAPAGAEGGAPAAGDAGSKN
jgi:hypothetical protein